VSGSSLAAAEPEVLANGAFAFFHKLGKPDELDRIVALALERRVADR
jgi:hypothetical protein